MNPTKLSSNARIFVLLSLVVFLPACGPRIVKLDPSLPQGTKPSRLPVSVGYYFSPEMAKAQYVRTPAEQSRHGTQPVGDIIYPVGQATVDLFPATYRELFEEVIPIADIPIVGPSPSNLSAIIRIDFEEFNKPLAWVTELKYRCTLYSADGTKVIASWPFFGRGNSQRRNFIPMGLDPSLAMQNAAEQFITYFRSYPGVGSWLTQMSVDTAPSYTIPPPTQAAVTEKEILDMPMVAQTDEYVVGADPFFDESRRVQLLGPGAATNRFLPVMITVLNRGNDAIWVQREGIEPSPHTGVGGDAPKTPSSTFAAGVSAPGVVGQASGVLTVFEMLIKVPGFFRDYEAWWQRVESLFQSHLTDGLLRPGEAIQGMVYLPLPSDTEIGRPAIEMRLVSAFDGKVIPVHLSPRQPEGKPE
jgi:hypothetical protein